MNQTPPNVFNRERKLQQIKRAGKTFSKSDFLYLESAQRLATQFNGLIKTSFDRVLVLGERDNHLTGYLQQNKTIGEIFVTTPSEEFLHGKNCVIADNEFLPFKDGSFDLVISNFSLQWVNDLPGTLAQIRRILRKGGFFCANICGGRTLVELRNCFLLAEQDKGVAPRISPFIEVKDGAGLLQRTKFEEPVSVSEDVVIKYSDLRHLLADLRNTGDNNALTMMYNRYVGREFFKKVEDIYKKNFSDDDGNINATAEIITISGWKK